MEKIKEIINNLNRDCVVLCPAASDDDIQSVNRELERLEIPSLPEGLVNFFKICGGVEYNGMVIYGTYDNKIVRHNEDNHDYYEEFTHLIFFGSIDDDIYTYNTLKHKYESRDINGMECWDEYDSFEEFFNVEMMQWLNYSQHK